MDKEDFKCLKQILESLPPRVRETARVCWDEFYGDGCIDNAMGGVNHAAWVYDASLDLRKENKLKKKPYEIEQTLNQLVISIRDLQTKFKQIQASPEILDCLAMAKVDADLHAWFLFCQEHSSSDESEDGFLYSLGKDGLRTHELEVLAQSLELIAQEAGAKKKAPNGYRGDDVGRLVPFEYLLFTIGRMVHFRKRPMSHILPIARKIHEFVEGKPVAETWGQRPLDRIMPMLKGLKWNESDEERIGTQIGIPNRNK